MSIVTAAKKITPKWLYRSAAPAYHYILALIGAVVYSFPSKGMVVIGVTGTKGKTTTSNIIASILQASGKKTGLATTVNFRIGEKEWVNEMKQTMLGRLRLQSLLSGMKRSGCSHAVIETSSEGILQYRHRFIDYDLGVFTNLSPEHIERHGSFENYRAAKVQLFEKLAKKEGGIGIYNLDDENVEYFLKPNVSWKIGFCIKGKKQRTKLPKVDEVLMISGITLSPTHTAFHANGVPFEAPFVGEFNVYNVAAAIAAVHAAGIPLKEIRNALSHLVQPKGRFERIAKGQPFSVIVDYAHEPASLEAAYRAVRDAHLKDDTGKMICVLGAQGGGRDVWKRAALGEVAATYCDTIILTNEDPYDDDPKEIVSDIRTGIFNKGFVQEHVMEMLDRKEAIKKALSLAKNGDAVIITGKGGEVWMCVEDGKKIPWSDEHIVEDILQESGYTTTV
jgi:UDP-N-acetylmuramoyl-L-alanyl-D-glutamate--2,6-diaminopimelate ligase